MHPKEITRRAGLGLAAATAAGAPASALGLAPTTTGPKERVLGIGGFFFRSKDPKALARWYEDNLGIPPVPTSYGGEVWRTDAGITAFVPFPETSKYLGDPSHHWMLNFRVGNLDKMAAQLRANGIPVEVDPETYPNGRFAKVLDPEGNAIQLWQPMGKGAG